MKGALTELHWQVTPQQGRLLAGNALLLVSGSTYDSPAGQHRGSWPGQMRCSPLLLLPNLLLCQLWLCVACLRVCYKLRDVGRLGVCSQRLTSARRYFWVGVGVCMRSCCWAGKGIGAWPAACLSCLSTFTCEDNTVSSSDWLMLFDSFAVAGADESRLVGHTVMLLVGVFGVVPREENRWRSCSTCLSLQC